MTVYTPLRKTDHKDYGWEAPRSFQFASGVDRVSILAEEIDKAIPNLPLAFSKQLDSSGKIGYELVALLSPFKNRNLFVKSDGSWLTEYVPLLLRGYPFRLLTNPETGERVVCIEKDCLLQSKSANSANFQPFFNGKGNPSQALFHFLKLLEHYEQRRLLTQKAVECLVEYELITPWNLIFKDSSKRQYQVQDIFRINPKILKELTAESLYTLHQVGALPIIYGQLLSEPRVRNFGELLRTQGEISPSDEQVSLAEIESLFGEQQDILKLSNL